MEREPFEPAYARLVSAPSTYPAVEAGGRVELFTLYLDAGQTAPFARVLVGGFDKDDKATTLELHTEGVQPNTAEAREAETAERWIALCRWNGEEPENTAYNLGTAYHAEFVIYPSKAEALREILNVYATPRDRVPRSGLAEALDIPA